MQVSQIWSFFRSIQQVRRIEYPGAPLHPCAGIIGSVPDLKTEQGNIVHHGPMIADYEGEFNLIIIISPFSFSHC
jgi:hypothetical protein